MVGRTGRICNQVTTPTMVPLAAASATFANGPPLKVPIVVVTVPIIPSVHRLEPVLHVRSWISNETNSIVDCISRYQPRGAIRASVPSMDSGSILS